MITPLLQSMTCFEEAFRTIIGSDLHLFVPFVEGLSDLAISSANMATMVGVPIGINTWFPWSELAIVDVRGACKMTICGL